MKNLVKQQEEGIEVCLGELSTIEATIVSVELAGL
jgi:hypothetical protein